MTVPARDRFNAAMATAATAPESALVPPQNLDAEESVLGAMMLSPGAIGNVSEELDAGDFYRESHAKIYRAALGLFARGEPVDAITVTEELTRMDALERVGGAPYIHTLVATPPAPGNAPYYARIVAEHATLRRMIEAAARIAQDCYEVPDRSSRSRDG